MKDDNEYIKHIRLSERVAYASVTLVWFFMSYVLLWLAVDHLNSGEDISFMWVGFGAFVCLSIGCIRVLRPLSE